MDLSNVENGTQCIFIDKKYGREIFKDENETSCNGIEAWLIVYFKTKSLYDLCQTYLTNFFIFYFIVSNALQYNIEI